MKQNNPIKIGLVIGKFAQLHNGHVELLKFALKKVDKVFVIVYHTPDRTSIPLEERATWIRMLFPSERLIVIEGWSAPNQHENTSRVRKIQEEYLAQTMRGINLTHIISSEDYGEHLSKYLGVKNIIYDKDRLKRPISSTLIREDFEKFSKHIPKSLRARIKQDVYVKVGE